MICLCSTKLYSLQFILLLRFRARKILYKVTTTTNTFFPNHFISPSLTHSLSPALSLSHTITHSLSHSHTLTHTLSLSHTITHTHSLSHTNTDTQSHTISHIRTHSHTLCLSFTFTHTLKHIHSSNIDCACQPLRSSSIIYSRQYLPLSLFFTLSLTLVHVHIIIFFSLFHSLSLFIRTHVFLHILTR